MDQVRQDLRHAARRLLRRPGFAAIAILTLGLGIGANVAIYTVVRAVLLEPLPYAEADRLALVVNLRKGVLEGGWISEPEALEVREGVSSFENVAYWTSGAANVASGAGDPGAGRHGPCDRRAVRRAGCARRCRSVLRR